MEDLPLKQPNDSSSNDAAPLTPSQKLTEAKAKYGKPFAHEIKVGRAKPPSHLLEHIIKLQLAEAKSKISNVRKIK